MNYHVSVGHLLFYDISVGVGLLFIIRKQFLQGSEGGIGLGFLLVRAPPFKLLPVNFHLKDRRKPPSTICHYSIYYYFALLLECLQ